MSERPPPVCQSVPLPGRGRLEVDVHERCVVFRPDGGGEHRFEAHPIFGERGRLTHATALDGRTALLARHESDRLHVFDAERLAFRRVPGFERLQRAEELTLHALGDGYLVVSENGVAALDARGDVRWRIDEVTSGWRLLKGSEEAVWLRDGAGNVLAFAWATGREFEE